MWNFAKSSVEGRCELFGVNIFDYTWMNTGQKIELPDPLYNQMHMMSVYNANIGNHIVTFAAGELSNGVYSFYVKGDDPLSD